MSDLILKDKEYTAFIRDIKNRIAAAQIKASVSVNRELLLLYWEIAKLIVEKQKTATWGDGFLAQMAQDLRNEFPEMKGFSKRNLELMRQWYSFWEGGTPIAKQLASQIPWWHNVVIISKIKSTEEAFFYLQKTVENNRSRAVLTHHIESGLFKREGKAITNFKAKLPSPQSDLAIQTIKDPYHFDFFTIREKHDEKELEDALIQHVTNFALSN